MATYKKIISGPGMFVLRSLFWLTAVVLLLPPSADGGPAPRISLLHAAYSARVLVQDLSGVCERNPEACAASREALGLLGAKLQTGAGIVAAGLAAGRDAAAPDIDRGTLSPADLEPAWSLAEMRP
jgi:hypothetical protein